MQKSMFNVGLDIQPIRKNRTEFRRPRDVLSMIDLLRIFTNLHPPSI